jgi:YggT family protein
VIVLLEVLRIVVFACFALSALVALGAWAVRTRRTSPFSAGGQAVRRITDSVLLPLERWLLRRGGNPQNAGWWLVGFAVVGGIVVISLAEWLIRQTLRFRMAGARGPFGQFQLVVYYVAQLVILALVVRVISSWFGGGRFTRWMRPAYWLTDWIVEPLRRVIPPLGMIDVTPIVAWLVIWVALGFFMAL